MLLIILIKGIASTLLYVSQAKDWVSENEDGDYTDMRLSIAFFGGFLLWIWLLNKIRRANMNDEDKEYSDRAARLCPLTLNVHGRGNLRGLNMDNPRM